ncbi:unnamed protein product [Rodentolepis nana]|uniref:RNase H domain-containing protein n=1 Tax=Rodentolepis nana TaxID=102285 RepID=A0A0R3TI33_RODNA|nr:unnamed protein product [Rodentolepis nana]
MLINPEGQRRKNLPKLAVDEEGFRPGFSPLKIEVDKSIWKSNTPPEQMRSLALETINVNSPADQGLQVFTDESYIENHANGGAGVYSELFSFYAAAGHNRSAFEVEIEAIRIALCQLCCLNTKFTNAVMP